MLQIKVYRFITIIIERLLAKADDNNWHQAPPKTARNYCHALENVAVKHCESIDVGTRDDKQYLLLLAEGRVVREVEIGEISALQSRSLTLVTHLRASNCVILASCLRSTNLFGA